ncbi:MAG: Dihydrolipoyl dehydrogenase [Holosporales bacterium]
MIMYDLVVLGAGPGGYVAAIRAAQLGLKTAVVEREHLGGVCLNWGCIPTKALLKSADVLRTLKHSNSFGVHAENIHVDLKQMVQRSRDISAQLSQGIQGLLKKNKIDHLKGVGVVHCATQLSLTKEDGTTQEIPFKKLIIATGAKARELPHLKADGERIWLARHAMTPTFLPKSLLIIGSGAIGLEFASFYNTLGVAVTVVEVCDRILPQEDAEISALAQKAFEKEGISFLLKSSVDALKNIGTGVEATIQQKTHTFDAAILAIGIVGNTDCIQLPTIVVEKNQIQTNAFCQTAEPNIYAIGDVAGAPWLAHKASHEGIIAAEHAKGLTPHGLDPLKIPGCTYTHPQIASVGLTEAAAKQKNLAIKVGKFSFKGNGKALTMGESDGLIKTIFDAKTGELLGAHLIGAEVTELIQGFVIAMNLETTEEDLMATIFPHPTLSEMMHESVLNAYGKTLHM